MVDDQTSPRYLCKDEVVAELVKGTIDAGVARMVVVPNNQSVGLEKSQRVLTVAHDVIKLVTGINEDEIDGTLQSTVVKDSAVCSMLDDAVRCQLADERGSDNVLAIAGGWQIDRVHLGQRRRIREQERRLACERTELEDRRRSEHPGNAVEDRTLRVGQLPVVGWVQSAVGSDSACPWNQVGKIATWQSSLVLEEQFSPQRPQRFTAPPLRREAACRSRNRQNRTYCLHAISFSGGRVRPIMPASQSRPPDACQPCR